jgi:hypothetical protein
VIRIHNGVLFCHEEEWNSDICRKIDGTGDHYAKWNKLDSERQISHILLDT